MTTSDLKTSKTLKRTWITPQNLKQPYFTFRQKGQPPNPSLKKDADNIRKVLCKSFIRWFWELYLCCYTEYRVDCFGSLRLFFCYCWSETLNVRSLGKQLVLFSQESWCFPRRSGGKHQHLRENKLTGFQRDLTLRVFSIISRLSLQQSAHTYILYTKQKNNWSEPNSRLGTQFNNTNLILKTTGWMIYKVLFLYYLHLFSGITL